MSAYSWYTAERPAGMSEPVAPTSSRPSRCRETHQGGQYPWNILRLSWDEALLRYSLVGPGGINCIGKDAGTVVKIGHRQTGWPSTIMASRTGTLKSTLLEFACLTVIPSSSQRSDCTLSWAGDWAHLSRVGLRAWYWHECANQGYQPGNY